MQFLLFTLAIPSGNPKVSHPIKQNLSDESLIYNIINCSALGSKIGQSFINNKLDSNKSMVYFQAVPMYLPQQRNYIDTAL